MKKLATGAVFATLMASSAFAQSYNPAYGTGNTFPMSSYPSANDTTGSVGAYAYAPHAGLRAQGAVVSTGTYQDGNHVGTDPDANIRFQLHRDPPGRD